MGKSNEKPLNPATDLCQTYSHKLFKIIWDRIALENVRTSDDTSRGIRLGFDKGILAYSRMNVALHLSLGGEGGNF